MLISKRYGDRKDAYRVKNVEPLFLIIPYIMKTRVDSQVYFADEIDVTAAEQFVKDYQKEIPGLKLYHVLIAAMTRVYSQRPYLNRYVMDSKIYARKDITVSLAIKKGMGVNDDETVIKPVIPFDATIHDVVNAFESEVEKNREETKYTTETANNTDVTAKLIGSLPHWLVRGVVNMLMFFDRHGILSGFINKVSPFHTSLFVTNLGSIGIKPIYHHIYEFGTTSVFIAIGKRRKEKIVDSDGNVKFKRYMGMKVVADERICTGHYFAESARILVKLLAKPEELLTPPEQICIDNGIHKLMKRKMIVEEGGKKVKKPLELGGKYITH